MKVGFRAGVSDLLVGALGFRVGVLTFGFWVKILGDAVVGFLVVA